MNEPLHERMRMTIAPNSPWRLTRGIVANWSEEVSILLSELAQAQADVEALQLVKDDIEIIMNWNIANHHGQLPSWKPLKDRLAALPEHLRGANEPTD